MKRITVWMTDEQAEAFEQSLIDQGVSQQVAGRVAIDRWLKKPIKPAERERATMKPGNPNFGKHKDI